MAFQLKAKNKKSIMVEAVNLINLGQFLQKSII